MTLLDYAGEVDSCCHSALPPLRAMTIMVATRMPPSRYHTYARFISLIDFHI